MFCTKCGGKIPDDVKYCSECGNAVTSHPMQQSRQPTAAVDVSAIKDKAHETLRRIAGDHIRTEAAPECEHYPHPYQKLGGWLGFAVYAPLVSIGLMAVLFLISFFQVLRYISYLGTWAVIVMLVELAGYVVLCFFCIKFSMMLKNRNPKFLRFYELTMITLCFTYVAVIILTGFQATSESVRSILSGLLGFAIWTTYFRKSVRVRTYMGSDAYLRYSIFFKHVAAPAPADAQPYAPPQPHAPQQPAAHVCPQSNPDASAAPDSTAGTEKREFCGKCGQELIGDAVFCSGCGEKRAAQDTYA